MQGKQDLSGNQGGVDSLMGFGGVAALPRHDEFEFVRRGQKRSGPNGKMTHRQTGCIVHPIYFLDTELLHQAIATHFQPASAALFSRLENDDRGSVEIPRFGQVFCGPQ